MLFYVLSILGLASLFGWKTLVATITIGFILYKYSTRNFDYWKKKNVPYVKPLPFVGNFLDVFMLRATIGDFLTKLYKEFKTPYFGIYALNKPHLVVKDPDLIKLILVKDFNYFPDHNVVNDESCDSVAAHFLFVSKNPQWKSMRTKVSPIFTTGRLKNMIPLLNVVANNLKVYLDKHMETGFIEAREACAKYSTDSIASCAFGINANCFEDEDAQFRVIGRKIFDVHWKTSMRQTAYFLAPGLVKLFKIPFLDPSATNFMRQVFWETFEDRRKTQNKRNDLIDMINQIMDKNTADDGIKFDGDRVIAQVGQFYTAGFETVSSTMSFTLYELCLQPDIQDKLRSEIREAVSEHKGFNHEAIQDMKYLHMVVCETLRKYPVLPFLDRMCVKDYKVPNTDLVIEKGIPVFIPMFGLHYDPNYFPDPEKYDPERFNEQNKDSIPSFTYIPFGEGPRICIGERFGLIGTKLGLAHILSEYEVVRCKETPVPLQFNPRNFLLTPTVGLPMKFKKAVVDDFVD